MIFVAWHIWMGRNKFVFEQSTVRIVSALPVFWSPIWSPPPGEWIKINCDGGCCPSGKASMGILGQNIKRCIVDGIGKDYPAYLFAGY